MKRLVIIHGVSGTGKTSLALALQNMGTVYKHVHPIGFLKQFIEDVYQLRRDSLEDYNTKYAEASPITKSTFQDILMEMWSGFQKHDPSFSIKGWSKALEKVWFEGLTPVTLSLRNLEEVDYLHRRLSNKDEILVIFLSRPRSNEFFTDSHYFLIREKLKTLPGRVEFKEIVNNSSSADKWAIEGVEVVENWRTSLGSSQVQ